jgi:beta-lactamase class A
MPSTLAAVRSYVRRHRLLIPLIALLLLSLPLGVQQGVSLWSTSRCNAAFPLLNPLRRCNPSNQEKIEFESFQDLLAQQLVATKELKNVEVSVYFRDMQAGPWFGINEDTEFYPASLTKLPTMMALLKISEEHPEVLEQQIGLDDPPPVQANIPPSQTEKTLEIGAAYPVREVLRRSIVYSDNYSDFLLRMYVERITNDPQFVLRAFRELGISNEHEDKLTLSVKNYSSLFRMLYNAQFLNRELSQYALGLLQDSEHASALRAYLPPETAVAHKHGYYPGERTKKERPQLHDCGIVYHPFSSYSLCIMTRGDDPETMTTIIAELSKAIYDEVSLRATQ